MDKVLRKKEKKMLLSLLELNSNCFSNFPLMKQAYKRASKKLHPDKGGNNEKMMMLNSLWQKYQEGIIELRNTQVFSDAYGTPSFQSRYREWASTVFTNEGTSEGPDLHCHEPPVSSSSEDEERGAQAEPESSGYNSASFSAPFSSTPYPPSSPTQENAPSPRSESPDTQSYADSSGTGGAEDIPSPERRSGGENVDGSYSGSQASFASTPPKEKTKNLNSPSDIPSCLSDFVSHAVFSNKTVNSFLVYTTLEKALLLYDKVDKLKVEFKSVHKGEEETGEGFLFMLCNTKHRLSAIRNFCSQFCTVSFVICKIVLKPLDCYKCICNNPFQEIKGNKLLLSTHFDDGKEDGCNWNKVTEFAVEADIDDPLLILAHYLDFACVPPCIKCTKLKTKAHEFHEAHYQNALLFAKSKTQKSICNQASDVVLAKRRLLLAESTREELLHSFFEKQLEKLRKLEEMELINYMAGVAWYACLFEQFDEVLYNILKMFTENVPKQRNVLFRGPVNTGKTTLAAALMDLVQGKSLNVNCPADKLNFELGCAIDRFAVVFEDVKGQNILNKKLQPGQGISNLDSMRDYLDGAVPVNLEKKHVNKRSQIFPPCICTMNEYLLPETLYVRFHMKLNFTPKPNLQAALGKTPCLLADRILQKGLTLFILLLWYFPSNKFTASLKEEVATWKTIVQQTVSYEMFCKMLENVEVGESPLTGIVEDDDQ
ncbi:large T-antigen [Alphapolyomavirus sturnirae]|uniref:Large T antigen n=1 Tax=Alphapolyomavirus sturnirae TaxID=1606500 RepID=J3ZGN4_9POLY|nr:large T-antigen [Alphapolyomavirus sturnirae]AFP94191.1 large T-antigen [Alphapolyomavirus sturnirae]